MAPFERGRAFGDAKRERRENEGNFASLFSFLSRREVLRLLLLLSHGRETLPRVLSRQRHTGVGETNAYLAEEAAKEV